MDPETFTVAQKLIATAHWQINFPEFCRRAGFHEDSYAEGKWSEWQKLAAGLNAFDPDTLARICGVAPAPTPRKIRRSAPGICRVCGGEGEHDFEVHNAELRASENSY